MSLPMDLTWISRDASGPKTEVQLGGTQYEVPLAGEMDFIFGLKAIHGALRTWPKKTLEARWNLFSKMCSDIEEDSGAILKIMISERGETLARREHEELLRVLQHWRREGFAPGDGPATRFAPMGLTAVLLDERHPWVSWVLWVGLSLLRGNAVVVRFLPENVQTASYIHRKLAEWGFPEGVLTVFVSQDGDLETMVCAHPSVAAILLECAEWDRSRYQTALSGSRKKFAIFSETRPVVLLLEESSPQRAHEIAEKSLRPGFGFERLGRLFTLDKHFEGWVSDIKEAAAKVTEDYSWQRDLRHEKWKAQRLEILKENGVRELGPLALTGFDFSNCSPFQQQVLQGPFISLTRSKYVHEAVKFAQTTPLKSHISLWGPREKMESWTQGLNFQNIWVNSWPEWSIGSLLSAPFSDENYFVGGGEPGDIFRSPQILNNF